MSSVDTVNAAATAIVTAESRVQPSNVQSHRRRWGSFWSLYWCFGSYHRHNNKRIGHAILVSESTPQCSVDPVMENSNRSFTTNIMPFIAPPSSPFTQSDPPSATQSPPPAGLLSRASLSYSPSGTAPIYTVGPYTYDTQLVSPPVFSTYTTEPSTAAFTPPPELVQMTAPTSPELPFAQRLSISLARNQKNSWTKWGSRVGSGSLTPNSWGSRLGSGTLTPNGGGISRLDSGTLTPTGGEYLIRDTSFFENQISEVATLENPDHKLGDNENNMVNHRVSFEVMGEDIPICVITKPFHSANTEYGFGGNSNGEIKSEVPRISLEQDQEEFDIKHRTISFGSSKDFNFINSKEEVLDKSNIDCEWWTNENGVNKELSPQSDWTFFPLPHSGIS